MVSTNLRTPPAPLVAAYQVVTAPANYATILVGLRLRLGLSQQQLATKVGAASKAVVYLWESGKRRPSPGFWLRIERLKRTDESPDSCDLALDRSGLGVA